jgi:Fur family ferric uptake transcriptional regulator
MSVPARRRPGEVAMRTTALESKDLRKAGLKVTIPRLKILEILEANADAHMSAEDVFKALLDSGEDIGLATVYRVLTQFETAGLVQRHNFEGGSAVFELDDGQHHDHIVCADCGRVEEFVDPVIEERQDDIAAAHGFDIATHSLTIYGRCNKDDCPFRRD